MYRHLTFVTILGLFLLAGCQDQDSSNQGYEVDGEAIATIDGEPIPHGLLEAFIRQYPGASLEEMDDQQREELKNHLINLSLLALKAEQEGLHHDPDIQATMELDRRQTLADQMVQRFEQDEPITDEDLRQAYEERHGEAAREYHARHILVESEDEAREVISRLDEGGDFAELAEEYSTGPTGPDGGDLGWFQAEQMVEPFSNAVRELEAGSYTEAPVQTEFGWHVILLEDTRETEGPEFEEVRQDLERQLREEFVQKLVEDLRQEFNVER